MYLGLRDSSPGKLSEDPRRYTRITGGMIRSIDLPIIVTKYKGRRGSTGMFRGMSRTISKGGYLFLTTARSGCGTIKTTAAVTCDRGMMTRSSISVGLTGRLGMLLARLNIGPRGVIVRVKYSTINCKCRCITSAVSEVELTTFNRGSGALRVPVMAPISFRA